VLAMHTYPHLGHRPTQCGGAGGWGRARARTHVVGTTGEAGSVSPKLRVVPAAAAEPQRSCLGQPANCLVGPPRARVILLHAFTVRTHGHSEQAHDRGA